MTQDNYKKSKYKSSNFNSSNSSKSSNNRYNSKYNSKSKTNGDDDDSKKSSKYKNKNKSSYNNKTKSNTYNNQNKNNTYSNSNTKYKKSTRRPSQNTSRYSKPSQFQKPYKKKYINSSENHSNRTPKSPLLERYNNFFGKGTSNKLIEAKNRYSKNQFIRINMSKTTIENIQEFLKANRAKYSKTLIPNCFKIEKSFFNISSSIKSILGQIYIQDLASQIPINCIDSSKLSKQNKTIKILDMAASPGSKTTQLMDSLNFKHINYELTALEPEVKRLTKLINNIQKQNFENIKIINSTGQDFQTNKKYDLILLDAPCSGNLVGDSNWLKKRDLKGIEQMSQIQKELLKKAYSLLDYNGTLIYSTCSLEPEENEENIDWILNNSKLQTVKIGLNIPFQVKPLDSVVNKKLHKGVSNALRFMPDNSKTQGFFVCCFEKK